MSDVDNANDFNRTPIYIALTLAILAVIGALIGARVVFHRAVHQPIALSTIDAPQAQSQQCTDLLDRLPEKIGDYERAELADPAPAGAAAWARTSQDRITLRCGIEPTELYTRVSSPETIDGTSWLQISDAETQLSTWYTVDRNPTVAITAEGLNPVQDVAAAVAELPQEEHQPHPLPLDTVATPEQERCTRLLRNLPERLGDHALNEKNEAKAVWTAPGAEPITLACGVEMPDAYQPGQQLTQINGIPWFEDSGTSYALGREAIVAAHIPPALGNAPIVELSAAITSNLEASSE
ncbi:DUF3515 domain-containing protein [Corynebacterium lowii]|uniref:DUF3515 domain-containing protein n=1 Tax=Corynebacterium lowii TaxID=1544413 RepID=A0A0Q0YVQ4_9CORY|nr:DUF3515 domain-containing protein [Corynebacterium lowii]KQB86436.1 hypothetical protein Clow_01359 [Corynebacterium lowii]MDP9850921.1 hypothetical protein [Corynebacterium lowii]